MKMLSLLDSVLYIICLRIGAHIINTDVDTQGGQLTAANASRILSR